MAFLPDTHQPSQAEIQALIKLLNAGQREKGEAVARRLVKNFPNGHMGHFLLAVALTGQRKWAPAIHSYRNALALKPDDIDTLNNMGVVFRQAGKLGEAADCYLKAQRLQPTNPDILYNLAGLFEAQGKTDDAINMYLRVVALMPRHIDALNNLAVIYRKHGRVDDGVEMLKTALEIHPKNFQTLQNLGTFLFDQGKDEEAVCAYKSALALETNHVETLNALGDLLGRQGHHDEAAEIYRKSLASNPVQPRVLSKLGDLLGKVGAWGGSVVFHRRASALDPDDMNTLGQLALAENLSGHSPAETLHRMIQIPATKRADVAMKMWAALTLNLPEKAFSFTSPKFNTLPYDSLSRFYKPDLDARLAELPALKGAWPRPDTGPVIYAAASGDYAEIFAQDFVSSVLSKSPDAAVHLHVMNPAGYDAAEALGGFPKSRLTWSFEDIGDCPKTLYSTRRFVRLAQFILGVEQRFMAVDVDSVFNGDASLALGELGAFDVALYPREREPFANQMVSAGVIALSPTTGGRDFAQFLAAYILHFDSLGTSQWFLDQLAIVSARAWFNNNAAGVIIKNMPQNTIDWSEHYRHDSLIWTLKGGEKTNIIREGVRGDSFSPADQRLPGVT